MQRLSHITTILFILQIHACFSHPHTREAHERCCYPEGFNGEVTSSRGDDSPIKFSVDYGRSLFWGEHETGPARARVEVVGDIQAQTMYIRETQSNRCWRFALGERIKNRCSLDGATYRGEFEYNAGGRERVGLIYDLGLQSSNDPYVTWLKYRSLFVVERDTCLPVLDVNSEDMNEYTIFHRVRQGVEHTQELRDYLLGKEWNIDTCSTNTQQDEDYDMDTVSRDEGRHGLKERLMEILRERRNKRSTAKREGMIQSVIQLDIYLYLLRHFFPAKTPQPCCRPAQWQASVTKSITYTYVQDNYVGQSTTSIPHIYVDHKRGRLAADVSEYVNGVQASNISLLALFGNNTNTSQLQLYVVDNTAASCTYIQVTDVLGPMGNSCMPATAQYERTVRLGGGPLNSVRLNVFNVTGAGPTNTSQMDYSAESYVTPRQCMPMVEVYNWRTPSTRVSGTLLMSDARSSLADSSAVFNVPTLCSSTQPIQLTYAQIESALMSALAYTGYQQ